MVEVTEVPYTVCCFKQTFPMYSHVGLLAISSVKQVSSDAALLFTTVTVKDRDL